MARIDPRARPLPMRTREPSYIIAGMREDLGGPSIGDQSPGGDLPLAPGLRSRRIEGINGLSLHYLEAGFESPDRPCLLLLHGFPELAFSWRKIMLPLAAAGYHVLAPDQRGYGRTTGWDDRYDGDLSSFRLSNLVCDAVEFVSALGYRSIAAVVGHDFGSPVAAYCALMRADVFGSVVLMSAPFAGPPAPTLTGAASPENPRDAAREEACAALAKLTPPRKHYQQYYQTREAAADLGGTVDEIHQFLRAYYHYKSGDWKQNRPHPLAGFTASELARMPSYYVMDLEKGMRASVAPVMPSRDEVARCQWLTESELTVYAREFARTGFQGGLNWYRCLTASFSAELESFAGRTIDVAACFIAGASDWGVHQVPGALTAMQSTACRDWRGCHLIKGAGHWVQQEAPEAVTTHLIDFLSGR